jgi:hypothetical protein
LSVARTFYNGNKNDMPDQIDSSYKLASDFSSITNAKANRKKPAEKKTKKFTEFMHESIAETRPQAINFGGSEKSAQDDETLIQLQDEVFSKGDELYHKVTLETIKNYKKAIADFLAYFVANAYDFKKTPERMTSFRRPKSSTIRLINERLEKFAMELFCNQLKQLEILERVDEIKGLIVDLMR